MKEQEDLKNGIGEIMRETTEMIEVPEEGMITEEGMEIGMRIGRREIRGAGPGVRREEGRNRDDERWRDDAKGGKGRGQDWDDRGERGRMGGRGRGAAGNE